MYKTLILHIKDAKCFLTRKHNDGHRMYGINRVDVPGDDDRRQQCIVTDSEGKAVGVAIPDHCLRNAIAVLMGDRPIPTYIDATPDCYYENPLYGEITRRAKINVLTTPLNLMAINGAKCEEALVGGKKSVGTITLDGVTYDLYRGFPTFPVIEEYSPETFVKIDALCGKAFGKGYMVDLERGTNSLVRCVELLRDRYKAVPEFRPEVDGILENTGKNAKNLLEKIIKIPVTTGIPFCENQENKKYKMFDGQTEYGMSKVRKSWFMPNNTKTYVEHVLSISADVFIPVTEDEYDRFIVGDCYATIMEGGLITVDEDQSGGCWDSAQYEGLPGVKETGV